MKAEDYSIVLDFMPRGRGSQLKPEPIAQVLGIEYFTLLEIVPKAGVTLQTGDKVYVGKEERDKIEYIKRRIVYKDLTNNSVSEIEGIIKKLVIENEEKYIKFFNEAGSITIRRHQLELLPGLGKKHMQNILDERQKQPFESYKDIEERVHLMPDVVQTIIKRVMSEIEGGEEKHYLFARPPAQPKPDFRRPRFRFDRP